MKNILSIFLAVLAFSLAGCGSDETEAPPQQVVAPAPVAQAPVPQVAYPAPPVVMPAQQPVIVQQESGLGSFATGALLGHLLTNNGSSGGNTVVHKNVTVNKIYQRPAPRYNSFRSSKSTFRSGRR